MRPFDSFQEPSSSPDSLFAGMTWEQADALVVLLMIVLQTCVKNYQPTDGWPVGVGYRCRFRDVENLSSDTTNREQPQITVETTGPTRRFDSGLLGE